MLWALASSTPTLKRKIFHANLVVDDLFYDKDGICVLLNVGITKNIMKFPLLHIVAFKRLHLLTVAYYWLQMKQDAIKFVASCDSSKQKKASHHFPKRLLPLMIFYEKYESKHGHDHFMALFLNGKYLRLLLYWLVCRRWRISLHARKQPLQLILFCYLLNMYSRYVDYQSPLCFIELHSWVDLFGLLWS